MSISLSKRRPNSTVPVVDMFNNWMSNQQKKVSLMKTRGSRTISTSMYRSTLVNDPQHINSSNVDKFYHTGFNTQNIKREHHNRSYSSHRNTQSRLCVTRDQLQQMGQQIKYLVQRARKTRLDMKMMQKQYMIDIQCKYQQLKQQIFTIKKLVSYSVKQQQLRRTNIRNQVSSIQNDYLQIKQKLNFIDMKITAIENSCGFMTLGHKLLK